jgi:short-subunit dehydrogenase
VVRKWVDEKRPGKIVFVSSIGGLIAVPFGAPYATTKHAMEALAGSMKAELEPFGIQVQVINPGGYLTGFNETEAESSSHWMDDRANYIKRDTVATFFGQILSIDDNRMDPQLMADAMVSIIPEDTGLFRNVVPKATEDLAKNVQSELWALRIDRSPDMRR